MRVSAGIAWCLPTRGVAADSQKAHLRARFSRSDAARWVGRSLSRTMPSADEAMVEDGRGRVQAYGHAESCYAGAAGARSGWRMRISSKKEFTSSRRRARRRKRRELPRRFSRMKNRPRTSSFVGWPAAGRDSSDLYPYDPIPAICKPVRRGSGAAVHKHAIDARQDESR